jgi:hypothetical protein
MCGRCVSEVALEEASSRARHSCKFLCNSLAETCPAASHVAQRVTLPPSSSFRALSTPVPGTFLGIAGQDPKHSKPNRFHVDIFRFFFIYLRYIL